VAYLTDSPMPRMLLTCALTLSIAGCFKTSVSVVPTTGPVEATPHYEVVDSWVGTWLGGIIPAKRIDGAEACPYGVLLVETWQSPGNLFVSSITLGIFTPVSVRVTCATGSRDPVPSL